MPRRLAFVVPRYGPDVVGGAETLCRLLAQNLASAGSDVSVLTTCARDHFSWQNELPAEEFVDHGVTVHRFPVSTERNNDEWMRIHTRIAVGDEVDYVDELEWMGNSVWSEPMLRVIGDPQLFDWILPIPYLFGTSFWAVAARPERTALLPCLHDEPHAYTKVVRDMLTASRGCFANCAGEASLIRRLAPRVDPQVVGIGYDERPLPSDAEVDQFCRSHAVGRGYLLYAGRRETAKGVAQLFEDYRALREARPNVPPLALMGSGELPIPPSIQEHVVDFGFVPDDQMAAAYAGASVFVHPSQFESLGMVALESWLAGTPIFVNGRSEVLRGHCEVSEGGLWYHNTPEFVAGLQLLLEDSQLRSQLAENGREYTLRTYSWPQVRARFLGALEAWE